jgi:hypothetical protein
MRGQPLAICAALALSACASSTTIPIAQDTFQLTARAAPACGAAGAERVAVRQAAAEVIRRGYDKYLVIGGQSQSTVVGTTPIQVQRTYGGAIAYGGNPIVAAGQGLTIKMFKDGDSAGANALSARATLGPNWQEIASKQTLTCFD